MKKDNEEIPTSELQQRTFKLSELSYDEKLLILTYRASRNKSVTFDLDTIQL